MKEQSKGSDLFGGRFLMGTHKVFIKKRKLHVYNQGETVNKKQKRIRLKNLNKQRKFYLAKKRATVNAFIKNLNTVFDPTLFVK